MTRKLNWFTTIHSSKLNTHLVSYELYVTPPPSNDNLSKKLEECSEIYLFRNILKTKQFQIFRLNLQKCFLLSKTNTRKLGKSLVVLTFHIFSIIIV